MKRFWIATGALACILASACTSQPPAPTKGTANVEKKPFGKTADGTPVDLYTLTNAKGMKLGVITYGGAVVSLTAPDKAGKFGDVVLGCDTVEAYQKQTAFFGALIGRYGNRIGNATFTLNGKKFDLPKNDGANSLHGGSAGFDKHVWQAAVTESTEGPAIALTFVSPDGDQGYPGALSVKVVYTLTDANELKIEYTATSDKDTVANLTNHAYFNLAGEGTILDHQVTINAAKFTPVNSGLIPTGELKPVAGTPFDFTKATAVGARIEAKDEQLKFGKGYDHNWVLNSAPSGLAKAAEVYEPKSGRVMEVLTSEPGLQFYTGNFLDGSIQGKGKTYQHRSGFCMETQHYPDSPNKPEFPTTTVKVGETYHTTTVYKFSAR